MNLFLLYSIWVLDSIQYKKRQKFRKINGLLIYGGVAQLGERHTGSVEVIGSIPTVSTIKLERLRIKPQSFSFADFHSRTTEYP